MAESLEFMYKFYFYTRKHYSSYNNICLQKSAQVVAKLGETGPRNIRHKLLSDNWFATLNLICNLDNKDILYFGTKRLNYL